MTSICKSIQPKVIALSFTLFYLSPYPSLSTPQTKHLLNGKNSTSIKQAKSTAEETKNIHPIDKEQQDCIDKNQTTAGMINCTNAAYKAWENEIDKNYAALLSTLSPEGKEALKSSQSAWIEYRDKELLLLKSVYENISGTMYRTMWAQDRVNIVKSRALELKEHTNIDSN